MNVEKEIVQTIRHGETEGEFDLNVVIREVEDEGDKYYVAECLEIPGCLSDGATPEEAKANIQNAMELCLSVIIEDAMRKLTARKPVPDLRNIVKQNRMRVHATPKLEYA